MQNLLKGARSDDQIRILENGATLIMEKTHPANQRWDACGLHHLHPYQDEYYEILEGILSIRVVNEERTYVAGERMKIPRGVPHILCNRSRKPARTLWKVQPAMNTAAFLETIYRLSKTKKMDNLFQQAVICWAYRDIFRPLKPPFWTQPMIMASLALMGRLIGYKAFYPEQNVRTVKLKT